MTLLFFIICILPPSRSRLAKGALSKRIQPAIARILSSAMLPALQKAGGRRQAETPSLP
jgi:hypothetical protein